MRTYMSKIVIIFFLMISPAIFLGVIKNTVEAVENDSEKYIIVDPGHGGIDGGGISSTGVYEKEINLRVSYILREYLENSGYNVILTRYGDYDLASKNSNNRKSEDINNRLKIINKENTLLFISIHCNIYSDKKIRGAQTFYNASNESNKELSNIIQNKFNTILKNTNRQSKSIKDKYLVDNAMAIGSLVEIGFLSNEDEFALLNTQSYQSDIAYCIYIGIIEFLSKNNNF